MQNAGFAPSWKESNIVISKISIKRPVFLNDYSIEIVLRCLRRLLSNITSFPIWYPISHVVRTFIVEIIEVFKIWNVILHKFRRTFVRSKSYATHPRYLFIIRRELNFWFYLTNGPLLSNADHLVFLMCELCDQHKTQQ